MRPGVVEGEAGGRRATADVVHVDGSIGRVRRRQTNLEHPIEAVGTSPSSRCKLRGIILHDTNPPLFEKGRLGRLRDMGPGWRSRRSGG